MLVGRELREVVDLVREYRVSIGGIEHTVLLSPEDAERAGAVPVETKQAVQPANKQRSADNKDAGRK